MSFFFINLKKLLKVSKANKKCNSEHSQKNILNIKLLHMYHQSYIHCQ